MSSVVAARGDLNRSRGAAARVRVASDVFDPRALADRRDPGQTPVRGAYCAAGVELLDTDACTIATRRSVTSEPEGELVAADPSLLEADVLPRVLVCVT
jgi:hypothetical protein